MLRFVQRQARWGNLNKKSTSRRMKAKRFEETSPNISDEPVPAIYFKCTRDAELRSNLEFILEQNHRSRFSFNGLLPYIVVCAPTMHSHNLICICILLVSFSTTWKTSTICGGSNKGKRSWLLAFKQTTEIVLFRYAHFNCTSPSSSSSWLPSAIQRHKFSFS